MYVGLAGFDEVLGVVGGGCDEDVGADVVVGLGADDDDVIPLIRSKDGFKYSQASIYTA